jgi:hypothetical protein
MHVRMAEWSKAPDSRHDALLPRREFKRDFWSSYEGRGSNPLPDKYFSYTIFIRRLKSTVRCQDMQPISCSIIVPCSSSTEQYTIHIVFKQHSKILSLTYDFSAKRHYYWCVPLFPDGPPSIFYSTILCSFLLGISLI